MIKKFARYVLEKVEVVSNLIGRYWFHLSVDKPYPVMKYGGADDLGIFGGYYDVSLSFDDGSILCHRLDSDIEVGVVKSNGIYERISSTICSSIQMGSRLTILSVKKENFIGFNSLNVYADPEYTIMDIHGNIIRKLPYHVYDLNINNDKLVICSLDFSSLEKHRAGYGYKNIKPSFCPELLGVIKIIDTNDEYDFNISPQLLKPFLNHTWQEEDIYVNHFSVNPSGDRLIFIALANSKSGRKSALFQFDIAEQKLCLVTEDSPVSHYTWQSNKVLLYYGYHPKTKICGLNKVDLCNNHIEFLLRIHDGHPTFFPNKRFIIYDDYANIFGVQSLYIVDLCNQTKTKIYSNHRNKLINREDRVDFHPRIDVSRRRILIDDIDSEIRNIKTIDLSRLEYLFNG